MIFQDNPLLLPVSWLNVSDFAEMKHRERNLNSKSGNKLHTKISKEFGFRGSDLVRKDIDEGR